MLIVMMGLPATGKTTIAQELAAATGAIIVNKDRVREAMFPASVLDYSPEQNDLCMEAVYEATGYILRKWPEKSVIIDGRTYSKRRHVKRLLEIAQRLRVVPQCLECVSAEEVIRQRFGKMTGHPAKDRTFEMYRNLRAKAEPLEIPRLTIDTGRLNLAEAAARCLAYLRHPLPAVSPNPE